MSQQFPFNVDGNEYYIQQDAVSGIIWDVYRASDDEHVDTVHCHDGLEDAIEMARTVIEEQS